MLPDWYTRLSSATGPAWVGAWTSADVVVATLLWFAVFFVVGAILTANWAFDVAFAGVVAGGIVISWPAMVVLSMGAVIIAVVLSYLHRWLAPRRAQAIGAEADRVAALAVDQFRRDLGPH